MTNINLRIWNWCRRFRNRCGYGVHSPSDFFLITFVIYESLPYYAYAKLHKLRKGMENLPHYREKVDKLLLRLVNYFRPSLLIEVGTGSGLSTRYMAEGNMQMNIITTALTKIEKVEHLLAECPRIIFCKDNLDEMQRSWKNAKDTSVMVHIGHTPYYKEAFEKFVSLANDKTCFIIGTPYADAEKKKWWKEVVKDERTGVTFDLYDIGLVFFDKKRIKEHRIVNFF